MIKNSLMEKKFLKINISDYPSQVYPFVADTAVYDSSCGENSQVLYTDKGYYIKIAPKGSLGRESIIIEYFYSQGIVPQLVKYVSTDKDYMVTKPAQGMDATHFLDNPEKLCQSLAAAMKYLHGLPVGDISMSPQMNFYNRDNLLAADTLIHGDFCLPNIMLDDYDFKAFIDLGLAGAGDRHIDLFWCIWSLWFNLKTDRYTDYFLDLYGRANIDMEKIKLIAKAEDKI